MRRHLFRFNLICALVILATCGAGCRATPTDMQEAPMGITVTSTAFSAGQPIPVTYTGQADDISPDLSWKGVPAGIVSFALVCEDPDAPGGTWVHWTRWNIPGTSTGLARGVPLDASLPDGSTQGSTSAGTPGYHGPMPPRGTAHRYYFRVYALDIRLILSPSATRAQLDSAMLGHVLSQGELMGTYQRH